MTNNQKFQVVLILLVLALSAFLLRECKTNDINESQKKALVDTTVLKINDKGQIEASKLVYETQSFKEAKAEIERLKVFESKFTKTTKQLTSLKREFEILKSGTVTKPKTDTVYISNVVIKNPTISIDTGDAFHTLKFAANNDKYAYQIKITDDSELKVEDKGKKGTLVTLLNKNPYVTSVDIKSVSIAPKKPSLAKKILHVGIGLGIGYFVFK